MKKLDEMLTPENLRHFNELKLKVKQKVRAKIEQIEKDPDFDLNKLDNFSDESLTDQTASTSKRSNNNTRNRRQRKGSFTKCQ